MEIKKSKKADLEKTRGTSMLIGYIVALAVMFAAFEWTTRDYVETEPVVYAAYAQMEEEIVPITQPIFTAAPPPPADAPQVAEILDIVENDEEIVEEKIAESESTTEAISGPVAQVTGPVATGPVVVEEASDEGEIFQVVEQMPEFPGGMQALMAYLSKNIKYPSVAQDNGIQGRVLVSFVVNKDGSIVDPEVIKSVDAALDKEAMRVIKAMPKWNPGKQRGKPVRVKYTVPVLFRLQ
ncbi:MAG: energy transducer TonB [Bacteroidaceae bacterium]|nr:energy transducer TonB [Bacteroidaceae bacterium]MBO7557791.1 energy transducer TonB [Bacteroidaceae bacterium]